VRLVYKHFPLPFHSNARPASAAALFAGRHGKFWQMHDLIFKNSEALTMNNLKGFAIYLGLDPKALESSVTGQAFKAVIDKDIEDAAKAAVTGTPTVFINGKRVPRRDFDTVKKMIDGALAEKEPRTAAR